MQEITSASTLEAYDALSVVETPVPRECGDKNVIVLCSKRVNRERVSTPSWKVLEESGRVENFHNGSELTV
jgi:hypothetical protein